MGTEASRYFPEHYYIHKAQITKEAAITIQEYRESGVSKTIIGRLEGNQTKF